MNKKNYFAIICCIFLFSFLNAQSFLSVELLAHRTPAQMQATALNLTTFTFGANAYKVTYETKDLLGNTVVVSGLLAVPDDLTKIYPLACYQHGTAGDKNGVPSRLNVDADIAISLAGKGYVTVAPDLLGLGDHIGIHPYVHADSEAWVAADMLIAVREYAASNGIYLNDQVFLTGYSQGGHSAMALHRELELNLSNEFTVTAASPMSGPYSIAEVMNDLIQSGEIYGRPAYLIYTFISYQEVYGNIYSSIDAAFKAPYRQVVEDFSNNNISLTDLDNTLINLLQANEGAVIPVKVLEDSYIEAVASDTNHPMNVAMRANNVYDWAPQAPTRLFYCQADEEVPYENSILAETTMNDNGANDVQAIDVNSSLNHYFCALFASIETTKFFADYQTIEDAPVATKEIDVIRLELFPNPATEQVILKNLPENGEVQITDMSGHLKMKQPISSGDNLLWIGDLPSGLYLVRSISPYSIRSQKLVIH
ncbi:MAG: T9SS type A sorting domain-containing protein [Saprospiraceae bacterium]